MDRPKPSKGDRLYMVPPYSNQKPEEVTVESVGRLYFYTSDLRKWRNTDWMEVSDYTRAALYTSQSEHEEYLLRHKAWTQLKEDFRLLPYQSPITLEQIEAIRAILKL